MADNKTDMKTEAVAPNVQMSLAPNGYIRVVLGYDLLSAAFYLDGDAARTLSEHFASAADAFDDTWAKINAATVLEPEPVDPLDLTARLLLDDESLVEIEEEAAKFDQEVEDAIEREENPDQFDA